MSQCNAKKLDQFYTSPKLAKEFVKCINFSGYDFVLEPTAGCGAILEELPKEIRIGYDLEPKHPEVLFGDAFNIDIPTGRGMIVGNLPFGVRNDLNIGLVKRFLTYNNIDSMALILPRAWDKPTLQKVFPRNWKLAKSWVVPKDSFIFLGKPYNVHCVCQYWTKDERVKKDMRWPEKPKMETSDFIIAKDDDYDFFMMGAAPRNLKSKEEVTPQNRGYKIKCVAPVEEVKAKLNNVPWEMVGCSGVGGGVFWITIPELIRHYDAYNQTR